MQKWLDENDILIYSTHNEDTSVFAERFARNLKGKIYEKMIANNRKSYLGYLNKLVDQYDNTYRSTDKKPVNADYSNLLKKLNRSIKLLNLKLVIESGLLGKRIFLAEVTSMDT